MAHEIDENRAFYVKNAAWHKIGIVLDTPPATFLEAANLIQPEKILEFPIFAQDPDGAAELIADKKALFRGDGKYLSVVNKDHPVLQSSEVFEFFEPFANSLTIEAGMVLRGGTQLIALAKLADSEISSNDVVRNYLMFCTSYDNSLAQTVMFTNTRVVCANTLARAFETEDYKSTWTNRHTKNVRQNIANVRSIVDQALVLAGKTRYQYSALLNKKASLKELEVYIDDVLLNPAVIESQEIRGKLSTKITAVKQLLQSQKGLTTEMEGTYWQGYNAITDFLTHSAGRNFESRLQSNLWGANKVLSEKALTIALEA